MSSLDKTTTTRVMEITSTVVAVIFVILYSVSISRANELSNVVIGMAPGANAHGSYGGVGRVLGNPNAMNQVLPMLALAVVCWFAMVIVRSIQVFVIFETTAIMNTMEEIRGMKRLNAASTALGLIAPILFLFIAYGSESRVSGSVCLVLVVFGYFASHAVLTGMQGYRRFREGSCREGIRFAVLGVFFLLTAIVLVGFSIAQLIIAGLESNYYLNPVPKHATQWGIIFLIPVYFAGYIPLFLWDSTVDEIAVCCADRAGCCGCESMYSSNEIQSSLEMAGNPMSASAESVHV